MQSFLVNILLLYSVTRVKRLVYIKQNVRYAVLDKANSNLNHAMEIL